MLVIFSYYLNVFLKEGIVLNMLLLMPIGILLPVILQKRFFFWPVLIGFGCSLAIELMQYYFRCGMFELDDLFNNTVGVWFGYLIYGGDADPVF